MTTSRMRGLIACATAACALLIALPGAAMATNADWSTTGPVQLSAATPFTVQGGGYTYTCPAASSPPLTTWGTSSLVKNANEPASGGASFWAGLDYQSYVCTAPNGSSQLIAFSPQYSQMQAIKTGSVFSLTSGMAMRIYGGGAFNTPYPTPAASYTASWTNGTSTLVPSKVTFTNATVGQNTYGGIFKLTGTFIVRTATGGLLTLS